MLSALTAIHVLISLIAIATGFAVVLGFLKSKSQPGLTNTFLVTTWLTSLTGFLFPFHGVTPGIIFGVLSVIVLAIAQWARRRDQASHTLSRTFAVCSVIALYFNTFVLIAQSFQKVPALHALAPTQSEPPFAIAQACLLGMFVVLGIRSAKSAASRPRLAPNV